MSRFVINDKTILVPTGVEEFLVEQTDGVYRKVTVQSVADLAAGGIREAIITLSSAQILLLNTTPITAVAAGGAGTAIQFFGAMGFLNFGTSSYVLAGGDLGVFETNALGTNIGDFTIGLSSLLDGAADNVRQLIPTTSVVLSQNVPLVLTVDTGDPTAGDSTVRVWITYKILTL